MEERTLASSERGLGLLYESEKVGVATAEELSRQKDQLMKTEEKLDDINSTLRNSEKHIQGVRSVFGSIRNYFSGHSTTAPPPPTHPAPQLPTTTIPSLPHQAHDNHPGLRNKPAGLLQKPAGGHSRDLQECQDNFCFQEVWRTPWIGTWMTWPVVWPDSRGWHRG